MVRNTLVRVKSRQGKCDAEAVLPTEMVRKTKSERHCENADEQEKRRDNREKGHL